MVPAFRGAASRRLLHLSRDRRIKVVCGMRGSGKSVFKWTLARQLPGRSAVFEFEGALRNRDCLNIPLSAEQDCVDNVILDEPQGHLGYRPATEVLLGDGRDVYVFASDIRAMDTYGPEMILFTPLSFSEYHDVMKGDPREDLERFLCGSTLPGIAFSGKDREGMREMLADAYSAVLGDAETVAEEVRPDTMDDVGRFILNHCGDRLSMTGIEARFLTKDLRVEHAEMKDAVKALEDVFLFIPVPTVDRDGGPVRTPMKYYASDPGMGYLLFGGPNSSRGRTLENLVYLELIRRGYEVSACLTAAGEIDFRVVRDGEVGFIQTAYDVSEPAALRRKTSPLEGCNGTLLYVRGNPSPWGVRCVNAVDWLLDVPFRPPFPRTLNYGGYPVLSDISRDDTIWGTNKHSGHLSRRDSYT